MFSHLIFLILTVLLITFAFAVPPSPWVASMWFTVGWGALLYAGLLLLVYWQGRLFKSGRGLIYNLVQLELLLFLAIFLIPLGGNQLFPQSLTVNAVANLLLYFGAIGVFYYGKAQKEGEFQPHLTARQQVRFLLPFAAPFLVFIGLVDLLDHFPILAENNYLLWTLELALLLMTLLFMPPLLVSAWQCEPMRNLELKKRLEDLCQKAGFKQGGILDWTLLNRSHTAAILGVLPRFRYVLFTKKLQEELSPEAIEAVLAHEIGHSQRHHLFYYPFIFLGLVVVTSLYSQWMGPSIDNWFSQSLFYPFALFVPYALILWLYFRYVFGFFSRLFERQADLHCFELNIPPDHMINALDDVARATGFTHSAPNWHHYSIQERIDFLEKAKQNPHHIKKHNWRVSLALIAYAAIMLFGVFLMEKV